MKQMALRATGGRAARQVHRREIVCERHVYRTHARPPRRCSPRVRVSVESPTLVLPFYTGCFKNNWLEFQKREREGGRRGNKRNVCQVRVSPSKAALTISTLIELMK